MNSDPKMGANSHSVVNLSEERPKKLIQEAVDDVCHIDKLGDELLLELLIRLPNSESATRCKSVSKHWLHLISSNFFVAQFERNRHRTSLPFAMVSRYHSVMEKSQGTHVYSTDNEDDFACFGLASNLVTPLCNEQEQPLLVAVHMDLMLFSIERIRRPQDVIGFPIHHKYVICNPRTKQLFSLPPVPSKLNFCFGFAIVCEPYCSSENVHKGKHCIQDSYRYRVFSFAGEGPLSLVPFVVQPQLDVYKSETHQREKLFLLVPQGRINLNEWSPPTMYNGKLHILNRSNIVAFDPFGAVDEGGVVLCYVIDVPPESNGHDCFTYLGTSSGSLLFCMRHLDQSIFKVWDFKDNEKGEWCLKHEFSMIDLMGIEANAIDVTAVRNMMVVGFHPYDIDIIYLFYDHYILECNMQARTSHVVYECQDIKDALTHEGNRGILFDGFYWVFLPWWPTPVPAVTQDKCL